jgi:hypothetical protein
MARDINYWTENLRDRRAKGNSSSLYTEVVGIIDALVNGASDEPVEEIRTVLAALDTVTKERR